MRVGPERRRCRRARPRTRHTRRHTDSNEGKIGSLLGRADPVRAIHGGVRRGERRQVTEEFTKNRDCQILLATDAAGKVRYFGVKTLNADKIALDFRNVAEEVIAHLRADPSTRLTVRIEIEATDDGGFDEGKVRTVSENASTLKFDQSGFEES